MMPNRLQTHWEIMRPKILGHWDRVTESDLSIVAGRFDRLVELIRSRYKPDRSSITIEAKIRDWLSTELNAIEQNAGGGA